ncbi:hypothetical protein D3C72_1211550 [compost metagenome]
MRPHEHDAEHRNRQQARHTCNRIVDAGCNACVVSRHRAHHSRREWRDGDRHAKPEHGERREKSGPIAAAHERQRQHHESDSRDTRASAQQDPRTEAARQAAGVARQQADDNRHRQQRRARFGCGVGMCADQRERQEEQCAAQAEVEQQCDEVGAGEIA